MGPIYLFLLYFPDLTSDPDDQTPTAGGFAPADIQCCWARTSSGLNPDQDTYISTSFPVLTHIGYAILDDLLHEILKKHSQRAYLETSERK